MRIQPAALLLLLAACSPPPPPPGAGMQMPPPNVAVVTVQAQDIPIDFTYLGRTQASREVEVRARVGGFLEHRHFQEGAMVQAGELLFTIDQKPLLAQAAAAKADVAVAAARVEQAAREAARLEPLVQDEAVSRKERDDAVSAAAVAKASLAAAEARLQQVQLDLQYTEVKAPIAGKIGRVLKHEGSLVDAGPGGLLTTLLQLEPIHVDFQRTENQQFAFDRDLAKGRLVLPDGGKLQVEIRHRDGTVLATGGSIDYVAGSLAPDTGTIPMRAVLANPGQALRAGLAVDVVLRGARLRQAIAVPQRAVVESPQGKTVFVAVDRPAADGRPAMTVCEGRPVQLAEWVDLPQGDGHQHAWVVDHGLAAGERVIVDNLVLLARMPPGVPVNVVPPAGAGKGN